VSELVEEIDEPKKKKVSKNMTPVEKYEHFLQKTVVRGKMVKVAYFQEHKPRVLLEKLEAQGWLDLFTNTKRGCSVLELAKFCANCVVTKRVVISTINGYKLCFDASDLGELLGVLPEGFDVYVSKDKSVLGDERVLELT